MPESDVRLQHVRLGELVDLASRSCASREAGGVLPITPERARAQAANPAGAPEDVALILATVDGRCVGYLGMFPVWLEYRGSRHKIFCLTTYFVEPEWRTTGAGTLMLIGALSLGVSLFASPFADVSGRMFRAFGFRNAGPVHIVSLRLDTALVLPRLFARAADLAGNSAAGWLVDAAGRVSRRTIEPILRRPILKRLLRVTGFRDGSVVWAPVEQIRTPAGARRGSIAGDDLARFVRDDAMVNWMLRNPWLVENGGIPLDYAFSHRRRVFRFLPYELRAPESGRALGYAVLRVSADARCTRLSILDVALVAPDLRAAVIDLALREAGRWAADMIDCGEEYAPILEAAPLTRRLLSRYERGALFLDRTAQPEGPLPLRVDVCDGDAPYV